MDRPTKHSPNDHVQQSYFQFICDFIDAIQVKSDYEHAK